MNSVAIIVLTYNQEAIIHECLESIVAQKVSGIGLKIHVIDDASTDRTQQKVEDFRLKYSELVIPWYLPSNQYQSGRAPEFPVMEKLDSDFIAFCDGDDFWIDEHKIQKQIDCFRSDESLALVHTDYLLGQPNGNELKLVRRRVKDREKASKVHNSYDLVYGNDIKKSTAMYRKSSIDFDFLKKCNGVRAQDWLVSVSAGSEGRILFLDEPTTVYRLSSGASFQSLSQQERLKVKNEVRKFCALHHPDKKIRRHFKRFLVKESFRDKLRRSLIYRPFRPLVKKFRNRK